MSRRMPPLNALRTFEVAARNLSFTKAAAEINLTQGAVSRQVKVLEDFLGFELFERTPRGVELNRAGAIYAAALTDAFQRIVDATDELATTHTHSILTIRGYTTFIVRWLLPLLPDFHRRHTNIDISLVSASDPVDFERDRVDLGIRYGYGRWKGVVCFLLFKDELLPVCSPALRDSALLNSPPDLARCKLLHINLRQRDWPDWLAQVGIEGSIGTQNLYFEDLGIAYECALAGQGVMMGQRAYVAADLAAGRLVAPFDTVLRRDTGYYLVCPKERVELAKIKAFTAWLMEAIGR
ncbi:MAG: transcriptional regulator GcvA [Hyphomicrobiaceae bacterium]|nr:transcriptional regulator GcvA [Hyphomicrobiaceae bacterium]